MDKQEHEIRRHHHDILNIDPLAFLCTGRRAVRGFTANPFELLYAKVPRMPLGSQSEMVDNILRENVDYIARTPSRNYRESEFLNGFIDRTAAEHPEAIKLLELGTDSDYRVYLVRPYQAAQSHLERICQTRAISPCVSYRCWNSGVPSTSPVTTPRLTSFAVLAGPDGFAPATFESEDSFSSVARVASETWPARKALMARSSA